MDKTLKTKQQGFNLSELLIVVAIVAIIAALALPSYNDTTTKTRRSEGIAFALEVVQLQERHYTQFGRYAANGSADSTDVDRDTMQVTLTSARFLSPNGHYSINHTDLGTNTEGTSYTLITVPEGGQATADSDCGSLTITNTGIRDVTGGADADACW